MDKFKNLNKYKDVIVALGVIGIILMIIIPLPTAFLDALLAINISLTVLILLMTVLSSDILELSVFPTLLLVSTLFKLGLNISSTRLILSEGYAGEVIESFGEFVVGGNYVVGVILFIIITIIQFVITNGAGRTSEVSARFALDSLQGKQMSIDVDLNSGAIDDATAKKRRQDLQQEIDFYGSMDGASKFVKGDAIAGICITLINIIGGIIIGVTMLGMEFGESMETFARLTIGDGLVSQIPALLISASVGIFVTKSSSKENFGSLLGKQLFSIPKAIGVTGIVVLILAFVPGMPKVPFFILSASFMISSYFLMKDEKIERETLKATSSSQMTAEGTPTKNEIEDVSSLINVEAIELVIGYGLIPLADQSSGGDLLQKIASVRRQCAIEMGVVIQPIRIKDDLMLNPNQYCIKIKGNPVVLGEIMPNMLMCMNPLKEEIDIEGIKTIEPSFKLPAVWINKNKMEEAELNGYTVVDPNTILSTHLMEVIKENAYELLGRQEVQDMIDETNKKSPAVIKELIPDLLEVGEVQKVLKNLLREKVNIKDRITIFETLADYARTTRDVELLTEYVRLRLSRSICMDLIDEEKKMSVITISEDLENVITKNMKSTSNGSYPQINPEMIEEIFKGIDNTIKVVQFNSNKPVILVSPKIRAGFKRLIELVFPQVIVLSLNEIPNDIRIINEGVVKI